MDEGGWVKVGGADITQELAETGELTKILEDRLGLPFDKIDFVTFGFDLHVFPDSNAADLRHSQMSHGITNGISLRIENCLLRFNYYVDLHLHTLTRNFAATSARR